MINWMKNISRLRELMFILLAGLCLCACGQEKETIEPSAGSIEEPQQGLQVPDWEKDGDREKYKEFFGIDIPELDTSGEEVPENVVVVSSLWGQTLYNQKQINAFNEAQSDYKLEVKTYETRDALMLDLVRGECGDVLVLSPSDLIVLSDKGGLEDLSPYLDKSEKVRREDLFGCVLEAGTAGGKLAGILPGFTVKAILVEKGYTKDGGWTIEEYFALMDRYPDVPLARCDDPKKNMGELTSTLHALPESFVDWEERSCSFDSESFIQSLEKVKAYTDRFRKTDSDRMSVDAQLLHEGQVQTAVVEIRREDYFSAYKDIRDAFLGNYELAGYPNEEGQVRYPMAGLKEVMYCMNAASSKKDAAWSFLEYVLSDYQEVLADSRDEKFPVRRDIVERKLQEETQEEQTNVYTINYYTGEMAPKRGRFTEEDKEQVLYILDHASPPSAMYSGDFWGILNEELGAFFAGDKTAKETARIIQNRVTTYLSE